MAAASLVLGIFAILFSFFGFGLRWFGVILGIIGIILGVQGKKMPEKAGLATAGMVCSIIGTVLCLLIYVACASVVGGISSLF